MNESNQIIILIVLGFMFILIGLLSGLVIYLFLKSKEKGSGAPAEDIKSWKQPDMAYCQNHDKEPGRGTCSICESNFCEDCLHEWDGINFCSEHLRLVSENHWVGITNIRTTPNNPEAAVFVYQFKREQWKKNNIPTYIVTHYKINFEGDHIESFVMLFVRSQDEEKLKSSIGQLN